MEDAQDNLEGKYGSLPEYYEKLFRPSRYEEHRSIITRMYYIGFPAFIGVASMCFYNYTTRRPNFSGIQKHILAASIGGVAGEGIRRYYMYASRERDAMLRHYIMLHPEDFPEPGKVNRPRISLQEQRVKLLSQCVLVHSIPICFTLTQGNKQIFLFSLPFDSNVVTVCDRIA